MEFNMYVEVVGRPPERTCGMLSYFLREEVRRGLCLSPVERRLLRESMKKCLYNTDCDPLGHEEALLGVWVALYDCECGRSSHLTLGGTKTCWHLEAAGRVAGGTLAWTLPLH